MNAHPTDEYRSIRMIRSIARIYRVASPCSRQISRDIAHVIEAYELGDREAALACSRYITYKYPALYRVASTYGLRPMSESEMARRTDAELQHMLYELCVFLYDGLKRQNICALV